MRQYRNTVNYNKHCVLDKSHQLVDHTVFCVAQLAYTDVTIVSGLWIAESLCTKEK